MNEYLSVFIVGGIICVIGQILMDTTKLTPARILVLFVTSGVILQGLGIYEKIVQIGKAGATVPLPGFGYSLANGVMKAIDKDGFLGIFTGGVQGAAGGISAAIVFGYIMSVLSNAKTK
ncbi:MULTISPECIES: stage V sporulation protein AE [Clostridium]|uniref:Stage V sporulation protein AE n=1 Tax=Clostridium senegalense TaxID=1465809 RepID=A0A6M0H171_9CLOT|nr:MULTISPECIES: stage V sporulation protein AE [Clostridium]NEU03904.1 stage V sporulation protein AE [Clostridium senegalense]